MPDPADKVLAELKKFDAENPNLENDNTDGDIGKWGVKGSHRDCSKDYRDSMKILINKWKKRVAQLKAAGDPTPEKTAAKELQITFMNISNTFIKCLKIPRPKQTTKAMGGIS